MNFKKILLSASLVLIIIAFSSDRLPSDTQTYYYDTNEDSTHRHIENNAFDYGESLYYSVGYKFITAGKGYFKVLKDPVVKNGRDCYDIRFEVRSLSSLDWLYTVRDRYRSVIDAEGLYPYHFEQHIREGGYKRDFQANFDQVKHVATAYKKKKNKEGKRVPYPVYYEVPPFVHDIVSALYHVRTMDLGKMKKGDMIYLKNFYKDSTYKLGVKIHGKETVDVEAGTFKCIKIEPLVVEGGLFKNEGSILVWVTDDEKKIPVKVGTEILIGFVGAELTKYKGIKGKIAAKKK